MATSNSNRGLDRGTADLALVSGRVITGVPGQPEANALTIRRGRVSAVGGVDQLRDDIGAHTEVIDLKGRTVIPGLIDSHLHAARAGQRWHQTADWTRVSSLAEALQLIADRAAGQDPGTWITVAGGWHPGQFDEARPPAPAELTAAAPRHPVFVQYLYEEAYLNQAGLQRCGIRAGEPNPSGGDFERDGAGAPTGRVRGRAGLNHCVGKIGLASFETQVVSTREFLSTLASLGMCGVIDPGGGGMTPDQYRPVYRVWEDGFLALRFRILLSNTSAPHGEEMAWTKEYVRHHYPGFGDPMLKVVGIGEKLTSEYSDGEGLTEHEVGPEGPAKLDEISRYLAEKGWPVHLHAIRPDTISGVLDVWEQVDTHLPLRDRRFALAHADAISAEDIDRATRLGIGIAVQNRLVFRAADSAKAWGGDIAQSAPPLRTLLERGVPLGGGTDGTNVSTYDPWLSIWWMVTGGTLDGTAPRSADQRLTRREALSVYTWGSAWFSCEEHERGRLAPGYRADLAVLSDHYLDVPDEQIPQLTSLLTLVGGEPTHAAL